MSAPRAAADLVEAFLPRLRLDWRGPAPAAGNDDPEPPAWADMEWDECVVLAARAVEL